MKTGAGTLTLSGGGADYNSFTGHLVVKEGTLSVFAVNDENEDGRLGNSDLSIVLGDTGTTGTFKYTGSTDSTNKKFTLAAGGTGTINVENSSTTLTLSGEIDGDGALIKSGDGTLVLAGSSSYTGLTTVSSGKLRITNGSALGSSTSGTVVPQGELGLEGDITVNGEALTLGSSGSPATLRNVSGDNVWTGNVTKAYVAYLISDAGKLTIEGDIGEPRIRSTCKVRATVRLAATSPRRTPSERAERELGPSAATTPTPASPKSLAAPCWSTAPTPAAATSRSAAGRSAAAAPSAPPSSSKTPARCRPATRPASSRSTTG